MANNRIELATFPRYLDQLSGKTTTDNGLHVNTDVFMLIFPNATDRMNALGAGSFADRIPDNTLALQTDDSSLYRYDRVDNDRANDTWRLITSSSAVTVSETPSTAGDTSLNTYQVVVNGTPVSEAWAIATWAQDGTTMIPRSKLPDMAYGERVYYASTTIRNANAAGTGFNDVGLTSAIAGRITWHQNDIAIVVVGGSQTAFLYVGNTQTTPSTTTNDDWFQLGSTVTLVARNRYINSLSFNGDTTAASPALRYSINPDRTELDLSTTMGFSIESTDIISINGVILIRGIDYTIASNNASITFLNSLTLAEGDSVHIFGNSLS